MNSELQSWWKLLQVPGIGLVQIHRLRQALSSMDGRANSDTPIKQDHDPLIDLYQISDKTLLELGLNQQAIKLFRQPITDRQRSILNVIETWATTSSQFVLSINQFDYPQALTNLDDAPLIIFGMGQRQTLLSLLKKKKVAIVGSRRATPAALEWTRIVARQLVDAGVIVVSGLAIGIDGAAHQGALDSANDDPTIAILGSGLQRIYPYQHRSLAQRISERACLLSEYFPNVAPRAQHFPARNRLLSGMVDGVVIVEAQLQSGSMITARLAADQGREVMAVPGAVQNPACQGTHRLIKEGAALVENSIDILEILGVQQSSGNSPALALPLQKPVKRAARPTTANNENVPSIVSCIDFTPTQVDVIAIRLQTPLAEVLVELTRWELAGWIKQVDGGYVRLK